MHIPDGFLDPKISYGLMGLAVVALSYSISKLSGVVTELAPIEVMAAVGNKVRTVSGQGRRVLSKFGENFIYRMGMVASLIFAAQMFNFPIGNATSGHLIGGVLAAVLLGPFAGLLVIATVLIVQSLFFADGGLIALGANIINMAFLGSFVAYYIYVSLKRIMPETPAVFISAWVSVVLAALATSLEIGFSGTFALSSVAAAMLNVHVIIGIAEGLITVVLVKVFRQFLDLPSPYGRGPKHYD